MQPDGAAIEPKRRGNVGRAAMDRDWVIAWMYWDCGTPEGIVPVGSGRPTNCGSSNTTSVSFGS